MRVSVAGGRGKGKWEAARRKNGQRVEKNMPKEDTF